MDFTVNSSRKIPKIAVLTCRITDIITVYTTDLTCVYRLAAIFSCPQCHTDIKFPAYTVLVVAYVFCNVQCLSKNNYCHHYWDFSI